VRLLNDFDRQNLNDASIPVGLVGSRERQSRDEALGLLCNQVGAIYAQGKLVPSDPAKACHFFSQACDFGNAEGCANLVIQYLELGRVVAEADVSRALSYLEKASSAMANARVFYLIGYSYDVGRGHAADKTKARQFYEQGAALGNLDACKKLSGMQLAGEGGPPDHAAAALWLQKAADAQDGQSCLYLARLYHIGDGVRQDEQKANALLQKACGLGVEPACVLLRQSRR